MSYVYMDHAGWMESHNRAANAYRARSRSRKHHEPLPETLSEFQRKVVNIVGIVGGGIYNAPIAKDTIDWRYGGGVSLIWKYGLATFDNDALTKLVFLCHAARIRCDIDPAGPRQLRLSFWQRKDAGSMSKRHPNLDEAVADFFRWFPADHSIAHKQEEVTA